MRKRILTAVLCLGLLLCALPFAAAATTTENDVRQQIKSIYEKTLKATGKESLHGYCGLMTAYQLYYLGVDTAPLVRNGKDEYDTYKSLEYSSGGHKIRKYSAFEYTLEEALYTMCGGGSRDVYNVLIGFESTNTEAGTLYGHALVIHAILDGRVYFSESFDESKFGTAGTPVCYSIPQFVEYYADWAVFEGAVEFGRKTYQDMCRVYSANRFVQLKQNTDILAQICEDPQESKVLRTAHADERLVVTAVYEDAEGKLYYRVDDSASVGFVPAQAAALLEGNYSDILLTQYSAPEALQAGENFRADVAVKTQYNSVHALKVRVLDAEGNQALTYEKPVSGCVVKLNEKLQTGDLPQGVYTYEIVANVLNHYAADDVLSADYRSVTLYSAPFTVGQAQLPVQPRMASAGTEEVLHGWAFRDGTWYCYDRGMPRTGWYLDGDIRYYLQADGSVTTGWSMIEGKGRFFSNTGAMRTGWLETSHHTYYMNGNGISTRGWLELDGRRYYFQENGWMLKDAWLEQADGKYYLLSDGQPAIGWHTLDGQRCFFGRDGKLVTHVYEENGENVVCLHLKDDQTPICFPAIKAADK